MGLRGPSDRKSSGGTIMSAAANGSPAAAAEFPRAEALLEVLRDVISLWHQLDPAPDSWTAAQKAMPAARTGWAELAERIQLINTFQWHEEDRSRAHGAGDEVLAAVKRSIDASNARRVKAVEIFDAHVDASLAEAGLANPEAPLHSESSGSIVDRMSVLMLKVWHVAEGMESAADASARSALASRLAGLEEQVADLGKCLDRLFADVAAGRMRVKLYRQVKVYRDPTTDSYRSDLD